MSRENLIGFALSFTLHISLAYLVITKFDNKINITDELYTLPISTFTSAPSTAMNSQEIEEAKQAQNMQNDDLQATRPQTEPENIEENEANSEPNSEANSEHNIKPNSEPVLEPEPNSKPVLEPKPEPNLKPNSKPVLEPKPATNLAQKQPTKSKQNKKYAKNESKNTKEFSKNRSNENSQTNKNQTISNLVSNEILTSNSPSNKLLEEIKIALQKNLIYPPVAKRNGYTGKTKIEFDIDTQKVLSNIKIIQKSSHSILDKNAVATIQNALKDFPDIDKKYKISVDIVFTLIN